jgi:hypothetical protein
MEGCGDGTGSGLQLRVREGKEVEDHMEWTTEMETQRLLDEMIAMTGLVDEAETFDYSDIGVSLGLGVDPGLNLDMSTLSGWDMDAAIECIGAH